MAPIENGSRLPDVVEGSFWCLWTRLDVLSKFQIRHEDVRSPLHPLTGGQSSFSGDLLALSTEYQGGPNVLIFGQLSVLWSILLDPSRILAWGCYKPLWGWRIQSVRSNAKTNFDPQLGGEGVI